jgi:hypothetical protein
MDWTRFSAFSQQLLRALSGIANTIASIAIMMLEGESR